MGGVVVNVTLSFPDEIYNKMKKHSEIKWTEIMRKAVIDFVEKLEQDEFKKYSYKKSTKDWSEASELFKF